MMPVDVVPQCLLSSPHHSCFLVFFSQRWLCWALLLGQPIDRHENALDVTHTARQFEVRFHLCGAEIASGNQSDDVAPVTLTDLRPAPVATSIVGDRRRRQYFAAYTNGPLSGSRDASHGQTGSSQGQNGAALFRREFSFFSH